MDQLSADRFDSVENEAGEPRVQLRESMFLGARFRVPPAPAPIEGRVRNISAGGLMAELPRDLPTGTPVEVEVRGLGWIAGRVAWAAHGRLGIAFDEPVNPQLARKPVTGRRGPEAMIVRR